MSLLVVFISVVLFTVSWQGGGGFFKGTIGNLNFAFLLNSVVLAKEVRSLGEKEPSCLHVSFLRWNLSYETQINKGKLH